MERRALVGLAELTGNDIRSCLHTLQFMQRKHELLTSGTGQNDAVVTLEALRAVPIGRKDAGQKDLFALLNTVFSTPSGARIKGAEELESGKSGGSRTRKGTKKRIVMDVVDLVGGGADDYDRIAKGTQNESAELKGGLIDCCVCVCIVVCVCVVFLVVVRVL